MRIKIKTGIYGNRHTFKISKPKSWNELPSQLLEDILWDIEDLDYCPYDCSKAECINDILNENISCTNKKILNAYWQGLSDERFEVYVRNCLESTKVLIGRLDALLNP